MTKLSLSFVNRHILWIAPALLLLFLSSCTTRITDFTVISSKNVDLSRLGEFTRGARAVGKHTKIFFAANLKEAMDRAIESVPGGVALVDGVAEITTYPFVTTYTIEGTILIDPELSAMPADKDHIIVRYDAVTDDFKVSYLNDEEFGKLTTSTQ